jgi:hypothetical protein
LFRRLLAFWLSQENLVHGVYLADTHATLAHSLQTLVYNHRLDTGPRVVIKNLKSIFGLAATPVSLKTISASMAIIRLVA